MRLYNAQSCTPMATGNIKPAQSFPPQEFLPVPKKKNTRKVQTRSDGKGTIVDRYQAPNHNRATNAYVNQDSSRKPPRKNPPKGDRGLHFVDWQEPPFLESRDDQETAREANKDFGSIGRDSMTISKRFTEVDTKQEECRECSIEPLRPKRHNVVTHQSKEPPEEVGAVCRTIPETLPLVDKTKSTSVGLRSMSRKNDASQKAKKRHSAFSSPLRIAKYSFHSPPPRSLRTPSTDSTLDLVFSPSDESPQISKNETNTTAATSEIDQARSDASESFLFDIEVVKSDSDTPAKLLETGSVISKSSSSTLTSKLTQGRVTSNTKPTDQVDELAIDRHNSRSLFSPVPWKVANGENVNVKTKKVSISDPLWQVSSEKSSRNIFEAAWLDDRQVTEGFSEEGSWIDFTNDPFKSHSETSLQRPLPTKVKDPKKENRKSHSDPDWTRTGELVPKSTQENQESGFILKKSDEKRTMDNYSSRQSNSGASEISFPSLSAGGNTWSQMESLDERDIEPPAGWNQSKLRSTSATEPRDAAEYRTPRLLGSVLQARFQANHKAQRVKRGSSVPVKSSKHPSIQNDKPSRSWSKPPLQSATKENSQLEVSALRKTKSINEFASPASNEIQKTDDMAETKTVEIAKYVKMLGMGIPAGAVKSAMVRDGVDTSLLFRPETVAEESKSKSKPGIDVRHFRIHWETHSRASANTVWSKVQRDMSWIEKKIRVDETEFSTLFQQSQNSSSNKPKSNSATQSLVRVIDQKRANNAGIALLQIKLSYEHTAKAIDRMDCTAMSLDQMKAILAYLPTAEEAVKLRQALRTAQAADWFRCECEKFMVAMLRVPDAEEKLQHMIFMATFSDLSEELKKDAILVQRACQEVMSSQNFRHVLALVLRLGNKVNTTASGNSSDEAVAIALDSLVTLNQSKAFDKQTTFLQYAASILRKYSPETIDWKQEDMPSLRRAHKVNWKLWMAEFELMQGKLSSLRARCLQISQNPRSTTSATATSVRLSDPAWQFVCQAEVKFASLKDQGDKGTHALESLWMYFGETCSNPSRLDSVLGTLVLFGHQWEQAVEHVVRREREGRRKPRKSADEPEHGSLELSPASSKVSQHSPFLVASQSYGHDV